VVLGVEARARTIDTFIGRGGSGGEEVGRAGSVRCAIGDGNNIVDIDAGGDAEDGGRGVVDGEIVAYVSAEGGESVVGNRWIWGTWGRDDLCGT